MDYERTALRTLEMTVIMLALVGYYYAYWEFYDPIMRVHGFSDDQIVIGIVVIAALVSPIRAIRIAAVFAPFGVWAVGSFLFSIPFGWLLLLNIPAILLAMAGSVVWAENLVTHGIASSRFGYSCILFALCGGIFLLSTSGLLHLVAFLGR